MIDCSFLISYRDREEHLSKLLPRLQALLAGSSYEIIIVEQDNDEKFQKNSLYNLAAQRANGTYLIFHDVDYYPSDNVKYLPETNTPYYPVGKVIFLDAEDNAKPVDQIPGGYRNFNSTVGDHSGGVFTLSKDTFLKAGGLNPYYKGWGKEDDDTRDRLRLLGYVWERDENGTFYALDHSDNKPADTDPDFINNHILLANLHKTLHLGLNDVSADVEEYEAGENTRWLKVKNFKYKTL